VAQCWNYGNGARAAAPGFVEEQHSQPVLLLIVLSEHVAVAGEKRRIHVEARV
jgi:hypothetical protein